MSREIKNALIEGTSLGYEDHGILTCSLHLTYGGSGQSFGGYALDTWRGPRNSEGRRVGTAYGTEFIARVLATVGVMSWEHLKGKYVRVDAEFTKIHRIGHIIEDKWFDPDELRAEEPPQ